MTRLSIGIRFAALFAAASLAGCAASGTSDGPGSPGDVVHAQDPGRDTARAEKENARGLTLLQAGRLDDAQKAFQAALDADLMYGPAHNNLGQVHFTQKRLYLAAREFDYAAKLMPNRPEPPNNLGMVFETVGKLDQAIESYSHAVEMEPDNAQVLGNLCRARVRHGDKDPALLDQLRQLVMKDTRPEWVAWAKEKLALLGGGFAH